MKKQAVLLLALGLLLSAAQVLRAQAQEPLKLIQTIAVPQVTCHNPDLRGQQLADAVATMFMRDLPCHFDRFSVDLKNGRLFLLAENNGSVEVYDLRSGKLLHHMGGFGVSHNAWFRPDVNRIYVSDGTGTAGSVQVFDGTDYRLLKKIPLLPDADSMGYDPKTHYLYVTNGGTGAKLDYTLLSIINTDSDEHIGDIRINVGRLEHLLLDKSGPMIFINLTDTGEIAVIDRNKREVVARWPVGEGQINVALDADDANHRLFVSCRNGTLHVLDLGTGKTVATLPIAKGTDDITYDPERKRVYVPTGEGFVNVFQQRDADHYTAIAKIPTGTMAKNLLLVNSLKRAYVGVPTHGNVESKILVYQVQ